MNTDKDKVLPPDMTWVETESSNLARYGYSASQQMIVVEFKGNGHTWGYAGPEATSLFVQMQEAPSAGKFFFGNIRNNGQLTAKKLWPVEK